MKPRVSFLLCLLLPAALSAQAGPAPNPLLASPVDYSSGYAHCLETAVATESALIQCIEAETNVQDAHLNVAYKALQRQLPEPRKVELRDAQRLWIKYRDAKCDFIPIYYRNQAGSARKAADCYLQMTAQRAQELDRLHQVLQ